MDIAINGFFEGMNALFLRTKQLSDVTACVLQDTAAVVAVAVTL